MSAGQPTAILADDEPLLRQALARLLRDAWPALTLVGEARNGREAVAMVERHRPDVCFLDVQMPGMSGVDAARAIGRRAHVVFVTAFSDYAVQAFDAGALDYLVKPVDRARLDDTIARLQERLGKPTTQDVLASLEALAGRLGTTPRSPPLRWIKASAGALVQLIDVQQVSYLHADGKYTLVAWQDADGAERESVVRTPLRELLALLDPALFVQVHRSFGVNLAAVGHVVRHDNETGTVHLRGRGRTVPVSRSCLHLFRQM